MAPAVVSLAALVAALALRPWRLLRGARLAAPLLGSLVLLPWLWALPRLVPMPLGLQLSMACLVTLMLGWPLAVPVLVTVAAVAAVIAPASADTVIQQALWHGIVPATLALALGAAIRRWLPNHVFVYILGRGFLGTVLCVFASTWMAAEWAAEWSGVTVVSTPVPRTWVAYWLIAWGDGFLTGLLTAVFVAFKPDWLATWSDRLYLRAPQA